MKRFLLVLILLLIIATPVSATIINGSIILGGVLGDTTHSQSLFSDFSKFIFKAPAGNVISIEKIGTQRATGTTTKFSFKRASGSSIDGTIYPVATTPLYGTITGTLTGGTTFTSSWIIGYPEIQGFFFKSNTSEYYYVLSTDARTGIEMGGGGSLLGALFNNPYKLGRSFNLDTTKDAYILLTAEPSTNPIIEMTVTNTEGGNFLATAIYGNAVAFIDSQKNPTGIAPNDSWVDKVVELITAILAIIVSMGAYSYELIATLGAVGMVLIVGKSFLVIVAVYTTIALIFSFDDSDDLFKSIGKFIRYEMKLFRFFMEIFGWLKKLIVWW